MNEHTDDNPVQIDEERVVDTFDVPLPTAKNGQGFFLRNQYRGVVLDDGTKLVQCARCGWTCPGDQSPGGHGILHTIKASAALRETTVGELVDALQDQRRLEGVKGILDAQEKRHRDVMRKEKERHQRRIEDLKHKHRIEVQQLRASHREDTKDLRAKARAGEDLEKALNVLRK